jgi:hypothetical protein
MQDLFESPAAATEDLPEILVPLEKLISNE